MERKTNVVTWFEIYVDDINRARKFYETVLNVSMMEMPAPGDGQCSEGDMQDFKMVTFPWIENSPNASGALVQMKDMKAGGNSTVVYFTCDDCQVEQDRVEAAGGKILQPKFAIGEHGFCAWCIDTEGNYFGLHSMK